MKKIFVIAILIVALFAFSENGVYPDKIVVGSFQALSGPYAVIGQEMTKGMKAYFNWINNNGGIYKRQIELIVADDQLNPSKTVIEVKRLVEEDQVFAIVGGLGTYGCLAVMDYLNDNGVPFVYQGSGSSLLAIPPKKYVFPVQPDYTLEGQLIAKFSVETLGKSEIAVLYMSNDVGKEGLQAVKTKLADYGMKPALEIPYNPAETDYSSLAVRVLGVNPDLTVIYGFVTDTVRWIKTLRDYGVECDIVTIYPNADPVIITLAGDYAEGIYITGWVPLPTEDRPDFVRDYQRFLGIYQESYPDEQVPSSYAVAGFIAAEVFVEGLVRAGPNLTREALVKSLESFDHWNGILSKDISWGPNQRRGKSSMYFLQVQNGLFVPVTDLLTLEE